MLAETYIVQSKLAKFNKYNANPTGLLCREEEEDILHFLLKCRELQDTKKQSIENIYKILQEDKSQYLIEERVSGLILFCQLS